MVHSSTNLPEFPQQIGSLYKQIFQEVHQFLGNYPLNGAEMERDNLLAYLVLNQQKTSDIHHQLVNHGLSALEDITSHVLYSLEKILSHLKFTVVRPPTVTVPTPSDARILANLRSEEMFGKRMERLESSIMVTLDAKMAENPAFIEKLLVEGMNVARINCAHDHKDVWMQLITGVKEAQRKLKEQGLYLDRECKIYMDLAGPKVRIGRLQPEKILVEKGDTLRLYLDPEKTGHPATSELPAGVPVTLEKAFRNVRTKDRIFIDDGKICGTVRQVTKEYVEIEILSPEGKALRVKEGKGLNLPDSLLSLNVPALTEKDINDLPFIAKNADIIGISFVHSPFDLKKLREELTKHDANHLGIIAKIETKDAVHHLARIILEGLHFKKFGIMIARGDLAVEVGPEYLSFVQDEVMSICSAAYVPVIWATGVLERLTKKGIPARSEITDVTYGKKAACIMLNKGPYIIDALKMLTKLLKTETDDPLRKHGSKEHLAAQFGIFP